jgi:hypothetical protein
MRADGLVCEKGGGVRHFRSDGLRARAAAVPAASSSLLEGARLDSSASSLLLPSPDLYSVVGGSHAAPHPPWGRVGWRVGVLVAQTCHTLHRQYRTTQHRTTHRRCRQLCLRRHHPWRPPGHFPGRRAACPLQQARCRPRVRASWMRRRHRGGPPWVCRPQRRRGAAGRRGPGGWAWEWPTVPAQQRLQDTCTRNGGQRQRLLGVRGVHLGGCTQQNTGREAFQHKGGRPTSMPPASEVCSHYSASHMKEHECVGNTTHHGALRVQQLAGNGACSRNGGGDSKPGLKVGRGGRHGGYCQRKTAGRYPHPPTHPTPPHTFSCI